MLPATFAPQPATDTRPAAVHVRIAAPLCLLLEAIAAAAPATGPEQSPAGGAGDDVFARLEAEMAADALATAIAQRTERTERVVADLLAQAGPAGLVTRLEEPQAQELLEWLNRRYVSLRTAEHQAQTAGPVTSGQPQSGTGLLGLDEADDADEPDMGLPTLLLAALVDGLQQALFDALG